MLKFDSTFTFGNILTLILILAGLLAFWVRIETSLATYEIEIKHVKSSISEIKQDLRWCRNSYWYNNPLNRRQLDGINLRFIPFNVRRNSSVYFSSNAVLNREEFNLKAKENKQAF